MKNQAVLFLSSALLFTFVAHASEYNQHPVVAKCDEIKRAFIQSEVIRRHGNKDIMQIRIDKKRKQFEESERQRLTEVYREFNIPIKRTFPENSQESLARLVIDAVKNHEQKPAWGWSIFYRWNMQPDNTRSLYCAVDVQPDELLSAFKDEV